MYKQGNKGHRITVMVRSNEAAWGSKNVTAVVHGNMAKTGDIKANPGFCRVMRESALKHTIFYNHVIMFIDCMGKHLAILIIRF